MNKTVKTSVIVLYWGSTQLSEYSITMTGISTNGWTRIKTYNIHWIAYTHYIYKYLTLVCFIIYFLSARLCFYKRVSLISNLLCFFPNLHWNKVWKTILILNVVQLFIINFRNEDMEHNILQRRSAGTIKNMGTTKSHTRQFISFSSFS